MSQLTAPRCDETPKFAALGGPETFNGQAANLMVGLYPELGDVVYYPTSDAVIEAVMTGEAAAACAPEQMSKSGFHPGMHARMTATASCLYAIAEVERRYQCSLLAAPGAKLADIRRVLGHNGSIAHSRAWLEANLPGASIDIVGTNSLAAAAAVREGGGLVAAVGSTELARTHGLAELVRDIDDGSSVNYWALSRNARFSPSPTRLAIAGRFGDDGRLTSLICSLDKIGFTLQAAYPKPTGRALSECDVLLRFRGMGALADIRAAVAPVTGARLAGAWEARS